MARWDQKQHQHPHQHHDLVCVCNLFRCSHNPSYCRHFNFDYKTYSILKFSHYSSQYHHWRRIHADRQKIMRQMGANKGRKRIPVSVHGEYINIYTQSVDIERWWCCCHLYRFVNVQVIVCATLIKYKISKKRKRQRSVEKYENEKCNKVPVTCSQFPCIMHMCLCVRMCLYVSQSYKTVKSFFSSRIPKTKHCDGMGLCVYVCTQTHANVFT